MLSVARIQCRRNNYASVFDLELCVSLELRNTLRSLSLGCRLGLLLHYALLKVLGSAMQLGRSDGGAASPILGQPIPKRCWAWLFLSISELRYLKCGSLANGRSHAQTQDHRQRCSCPQSPGKQSSHPFKPANSPNHGEHVRVRIYQSDLGGRK